jgi:hypothetical protein
LRRRPPAPRHPRPTPPRPGERDARPTGRSRSTSVVGSHAHPGWLDLAVAAAERGELGPVDIREVKDDAVDLALRDQEEAGIDVVSEGEMRRVGFFTAELYRHLSCVRRSKGPPPRPADQRTAGCWAIAAPATSASSRVKAARTRTARP